MVQEALEGVAPCEVVQQVLDGNARIRKYGSAAEHVRIGSHDGFKGWHVLQNLLNPMLHPTDLNTRKLFVAARDAFASQVCHMHMAA